MAAVSNGPGKVKMPLSLPAARALAKHESTASRRRGSPIWPVQPISTARSPWAHEDPGEALYGEYFIDIRHGLYSLNLGKEVGARIGAG